MDRLKKNTNYFGFFVLGVVFTIVVIPVVTPVLSTVKEIFWDFEIPSQEVQSMASYPYYHMARLYTKPGLGEQAFTLEVDGRIVWVSGAAAGGDLNEKLIWDETGNIVSLELAGKRVVSYNTILKRLIEE
jgi:hypothetical protein